MIELDDNYSALHELPKSYPALRICSSDLEDFPDSGTASIWYEVQTRTENKDGRYELVLEVKGIEPEEEDDGDSDSTRMEKMVY